MNQVCAVTSVPCGCVCTRGHVWVEQEPGSEGTRGRVTYSQRGSDPCPCRPCPRPPLPPVTAVLSPLSPHALRPSVRPQRRSRKVCRPRPRPSRSPLPPPSLPPSLPACVTRPHSSGLGPSGDRLGLGCWLRRASLRGAGFLLPPIPAGSNQGCGEALPRPPAGSWGWPIWRPSLG